MRALFVCTVAVGSIAAHAVQPVDTRSTTGITASVDADSDWARRSHADGVVIAVGFDSIEEWGQYSADRTGCNSAYQVRLGLMKKAGCRNNAWDPNVHASGKGSVRFDILSQTNQGDGGSMAIPFGDYATNQFGANSDLWISWRQRMDARFIAGYRAAGQGYANAKQVIIAQGDMADDSGKKTFPGNACSEAEVVVVSSNPGKRPPFPTGYIECGRYVAFEQVLKPGFYAGDPKGSMPITRQNARIDSQGKSSCVLHPDTLDQSGCFTYRPDEWITYMVHLKLGAEGRAVSSVSGKEQPGYIDSTYELLAAYPGEDFQLLHHQPNVVIPKGQYYVGGDPMQPSSYKPGWGPGDAHPQARFGKLWLLPYMTNKDVTEVSPKASTWYDEVIVSRCRIAAPGRPAPRECNPAMKPVSVSTGERHNPAPVPVAVPSQSASLDPPRSNSARVSGSTPPASASVGISPLQLSAVIQNLRPGQWFEIPHSEMLRVQVDACKMPAIRKAYDRVGDSTIYCNPDDVMMYSGGAYDTKRHRLIVWGGGHSGYAGNEIYAFDIQNARWTRLTEPTPPLLENELNKEQKRFVALSPPWHDPDFPPTPTSVHSYDQLEYLPDQDMLFAAGGATFSANGYASAMTWLFDLSKNDATGWIQAQPMPGKAYGLFEFNMSTAYDPISRKVVMRGYSQAGTFDPVTKGWKVTLNGLRSRDLGTVGEIDPKRRLFVVIGLGKAELYRVNAEGEIDSPPQPLASSGDKDVEQCYAPGLVYDGKADRLVAWCGKGDVYSLNLDTRTWSRHRLKAASAVPGDPANTPGIRGTYGRFRYMPELNAYVVVNGIRENVFLFRLADDKGVIAK